MSAQAAFSSNANQTVFIPAGHPLLAHIKAPKTVAVAAPKVERNRTMSLVPMAISLVLFAAGFSLGQAALKLIA